MIHFRSLNIQGCLEIENFFSEDERGFFVKTFHSEKIADIGLDFNIRESYYTQSRKGVLRGMHFQIPPYDHHKLVYCIQGKVLDVVLDLRKSSPSYLQFTTLELVEKSNSILIPKGCAHGFLALEEDSILVYSVSTVYNPKYDSGILWNSIGVEWPVQNPLLSERDQKFSKLEEFESPFI